MAKQIRKHFSAWKIVSYWKEWQNEHQTWPPWSSHGWDWGEPACMAGGHWKPEWDNETTAAKAWTASGLQKCHVVPLRLDGIDDVSNMVLMCDRCHHDQPDSTDPEVTWRYMKSRRLWDCGTAGGALTSALLALTQGATYEDAEKIMIEGIAGAYGQTIEHVTKYVQEIKAEARGALFT